jgi:hypothetical protein
MHQLVLPLSSYNYRKGIPIEPVIPIDNSNVVKPDGFKFESLGIVRDGSASTATKNICKKVYPVTQARILTNSNHPVSIFLKFILLAKRIILLPIRLHLQLCNMEFLCLITHFKFLFILARKTLAPTPIPVDVPFLF